MVNFKNSSCLMVFSALFFFLSCEEETLSDQSFGTLEGKVVAKGLNTSLENVKITTNPSSTTVFSDSEGNFTIDEIEIGNYSVQADKDEFLTAFEPANILSGKKTTVIFEMDSIDANNLPPLEPKLLFPVDKSNSVNNPVQFVWSSSANDADEIVYALELRNGSTGETQVFEAIMDTVFTVDKLSFGANYFWQVIASDEITSPVQSKISSFQLQSIAENRFLYVRTINGNNVIFSGGEPTGINNQEVDQNEIQLTSSTINAFRPKANRALGKIAFIRTFGGEDHLFTMNMDGTDQRQITKDVPVAGFRQDEMEFSWNNNGSAIYYPNFNKLYAINSDGSGTQLVYEAAQDEFITEVAPNPINQRIVVKINNPQGYNVKLRVLDPNLPLGVQTIIAGIPGAFGGLDYAPDGNKILYTRDVSGTENAQYRRLDNRIFEFDLVTNTSTEIDTQKASGFNNLDAKYAPNGGFVIFTSTSNDGISEKRIVRKQLGTFEIIQNELLFTNAFMPNWE